MFDEERESALTNGIRTVTVLFAVLASLQPNCASHISLELLIPNELVKIKYGMTLTGLYRVTQLGSAL